MPGFGSQLSNAKESVEKLKNMSGTHEMEKIAALATKTKETNEMIEKKDALTDSFLGKKELSAETLPEAKKQPWWKRSLKWVVGGGFGLILGKEFFGGKKENIEQAAENVTEVVDESIDVWTDEERLREVNDSIEQGKKTKKEIEDLEKKINVKYKFKPGEKIDDWRVYLQEKKEKYADYGFSDAWKEAWKKTEFEYDSETGEQIKKRGFFWRLFAFVPSLIGTYKSWKTFEKMKATGMLDTIEELDKKGQEAKEKFDEAEDKIEEGIESKHEAFSAVFEENPYALNLSKQYFQKLGNLTKNADKYTSLQRAEQIRAIHREIGQKGVAKFGLSFGKMKNFEKYLPSLKVKTRGKLVFVEVVGKSLGAALRSGAEKGGWSSAWDVFKTEVTDADNWKDAAPIWGTIRSFQRLGVDDGVSDWSKWLEAGLSLGMDAATVVGVVGSFGLASPGVLAARTAAGAVVRSGTRKLALRQMMKQSARAGEKFVAEAATKETRKEAGKMIMRTAGGKWAFKVNLMMTTISQFFGESVEEEINNVKAEIREEIYTPEQKRFLELTRGAEFSNSTTPGLDEQETVAPRPENLDEFTEGEKAAADKEHKKRKTKLKVVHKKPTAEEIVKAKEEESPSIDLADIKEAGIELVKKNAA